MFAIFSKVKSHEARKFSRFDCNWRIYILGETIMTDFNAAAHELELQIVEFKSEILLVSLRQILDTVTVLFMS